MRRVSRSREGWRVGLLCEYNSRDCVCVCVCVCAWVCMCVCVVSFDSNLRVFRGLDGH